jgi:hypothetical protein
LRQAGGSEEQLALNRRSHDTILRFVNGVFERLIGPGHDLWLQPAYRPVHPSRDIALDGPGVGLNGPQIALKASEAKRHEARQIAA